MARQFNTVKVLTDILEAMLLKVLAIALSNFQSVQRFELLEPQRLEGFLISFDFLLGF